VTDQAFLDAFLATQDALVACLPYHANLPVAEAAHRAGIHYFDLTEDVATTVAIRDMAKTSKGLMAPQCGLAPGFIGIVGAELCQRFTKLRDVELRVGALPRYPNGQLRYSFTWSPAGVINEYINDAREPHLASNKFISCQAPGRTREGGDAYYRKPGLS
jgi:saccharopine dehydrogenase-like NADP-dependent oxidoreductase